MNTNIIVSKFGGTSLADAKQIQKVVRIVRADPRRRYVVVSAPGKRNLSDEKVTDLLYRINKEKADNRSGRELLEIIKARYIEIVEELGINVDLIPYFEKIWQNIQAGYSTDYLVSRGEYLNGLIVAQVLGFPFIDAAALVCFDARGKYNPRATAKKFTLIIKKLHTAVIPGFYGSKRNGEIQTFSRGGSDITGAIIAAEVKADVYENWTDVPGILMAHPLVVKNPKKIETLTYTELRELAYMGANVLHDEAVLPVRKAGIPIHVRNTNDPENEGTRIVPPLVPDERISGRIIGIAGRKDFTIITVTKTMMNQEIGFARKICTVLEKHHVSFEHMASGIDSLSIIIADNQIEDKLEMIKYHIQTKCLPDSIEICPKISLICIVGQAMAHTPGVAAKAFKALGNADINVRVISQGSSEINIIVGVKNSDYEGAIRAIYRTFEN